MMINQIEQSVISSLLWSFNLPKEEEHKIKSILLDADLFKDAFHRAIISTINEFRAKDYLIDELTVSDSLIKRSMMNNSKWIHITSQTAGGYLFITSYLKLLKEQSKSKVFDV